MTLRSTTPERLRLVRDVRETTVLGSIADERVEEMRQRLAIVLFRKGYSSYHAVQFAWANSRPDSDLSNNPIAN